MFLPREYLITGQFVNEDDFIHKLEKKFFDGFKLIQIRAKHMSKESLISLSKLSIKTAEKYEEIKIIINTTPEIACLIDPDGIHLTSENLMKISRRPLPKNKLVVAACHNIDQLNKAIQIEADFVTLSPVQYTNCHPEAKPLGWEYLEEVSKKYPIPIFALGGMRDEKISNVTKHGAYGIASISWW